MSDQQTAIKHITEGSPEHRAAVVASIRALADFVEQRTDLPVPDGVYAQHSILGGTDEDKTAIVMESAAVMGVQPQTPSAAIYACTVVAVSSYLDRAEYTVHGRLTGQVAEGGEQA